MNLKDIADALAPKIAKKMGDQWSSVLNGYSEYYSTLENPRCYEYIMNNRLSPIVILLSFHDGSVDLFMFHAEEDDICMPRAKKFEYINPNFMEDMVKVTKEFMDQYFIRKGRNK